MRDEDGGDDEQHPGESHGGETDSTQESSCHFGMHGGQSHTRQSHGEEALGETAGLLQEVQEAVDQTCTDGHQEEQEQETDRTKTLLQAATEEHQGCDV